MNTTDFWYKLVDMTKSDTALFTVGGFAFTEKYLIWIIGLVVLGILGFGLRAAFLWVTGADLTKKAEAETAAQSVPTTTQPASTTLTPTPVPSDTTTPQVQTPVAKADTTSEVNKTPQELLTDTSDRKRTLHDFVTPDTIHAEVMKQTLNNDFPYQTVKPDPTKVGTPVVEATQTPAAPQTFGAPVVNPLPPIVQQNPPVAQAPNPIQAPVSQPEPTSTTTEVPAPVQPVPQQVAAAVPAPAVTMQVPPETFSPTPVQTAPTVTTDVSASSPAVPPVQVPAAQPMPPSTQSPAPTTNSVLPPLPATEPRASMIVGVADAKGSDAVTTKQYNPVDPVIP